MANVDVHITSIDYGETDFGNCVCPTDGGDLQIVEPPSIVTALPESEYGVDIDVLNDIRPAFTLCRDLANMGNAIARRLMTPAGSLAEIGDDPDYGYDIRGLLNADMTEAEIAGVRANIEQEVMKDERVQSVDVSSVFSYSTSQIAIELNILLKTGVDFRLVLAVGTVTVDVIDEGIAAS